MGIAAIGPVMQIAFVPDDFDAALEHWTKAMGVGPFYVIERLQLEEMRYRGQPSQIVFTVAIAYWGDVQVELIRQDSPGPSIYTEMRNGGAMHHVCVMTDDIEKAKAIALEAGCEMLVEANVGTDGRLFYADSKGYPGGIVEVLQPATGSDGLFAMIRDAARGWDGKDPVRKLAFQ